MAKGRNANLRTLTPEQAREQGRRGGQKSAEARREKKKLKECLEALLENEFTDKRGNVMTGAEALAAQLFKKAMSGDVKAFEVLRDTAGQKPVDVIEQTTKTVDMSQFSTEEIKRMLDDEV